ncbi:molybdenum cofactor guanylyltransferase [Deinococcus sp. UYEF24]
MNTDELAEPLRPDAHQKSDAAASDVHLAAAITAGGQSRRFGQDKALYPVRGVPLLNRVAGSLEAFAPKLLIAPAGRYTLTGWSNHSDFRPGEGPLAGLETALSMLDAHHAAQQLATPHWLAFAAVDLPNLTARYWQLLAGRAGPEVQPAVQAVFGLDDRQRPQPLAGLYHVSLLPLVTALLDAGERRMQTLIEHLNPEQIDPGEPPSENVPGCELVAWEQVEAVCPGAYVNLNTPPE